MTRAGRATAVIAAVAIATGALGAAPAFADDAADVDPAISAINVVDPSFLQWDGEGVALMSSKTLPALSGGPVRVGNHGIGLLPAFESSGVAAQQVAPNVAAFLAPDVTHVVADRGNGLIGIAAVIESAAAGERFRYDFSAEAGITAELGEVNGGILFLQGDDVVGGVLPPWAIDANGDDVPTHYEITEGGIAQVVEHAGAGFAYPIVADPTYYGESLIDYVTATSSPWEAHVYTSGWWATNIAIGNNVVRLQVTDEFARITPSAYDTQGAREQVSCHAWWAALKHPWNIELWRPTVGEAATVAAACNP